MIKEITKYVFVSATFTVNESISDIAYKTVTHKRDYLLEFEDEPSLEEIRNRVREIMAYSGLIRQYDEINNICIDNLIFLSKSAFETLNGK